MTAGDARRSDAMKHMKPKEAHEFLQKNPEAVLIDCRSEVEYLYVGHPVPSHHVAWNDGPDWDINPHFVGQVKKVTQSMDRPVVLICRSGQRSVAAGVELEKAGFADVSNVLEGFEGALDEKKHRGMLGGWRKENLPWEQT
jgi:rhodanese-related sulfurtransferase